VSVAEWFWASCPTTQGDRLEIDFGFRAQVRNQHSVTTILPDTLLHLCITVQCSEPFSCARGSGFGRPRGGGGRGRALPRPKRPGWHRRPEHMAPHRRKTWRARTSATPGARGLTPQHAQGLENERDETGLHPAHMWHHPAAVPERRSTKRHEENTQVMQAPQAPRGPR